MSEEQREKLKSYQIKGVDELLKERLTIPAYQRPYKWTVKNTADLMDDISHAVSENERYKNDGYKYRIGTVLLHDKNDGTYDIVDGQQRIITLVLLKRCLEGAADLPPSIRDRDYTGDGISQRNIHDNYRYICEYLGMRESEKKKIKSALKDILEVVVLVVKKETEAFQLFDSQNTRGRELDPHDLLKAYHLRAMRRFPFEMQRAVVKWERIEPERIKILFSDFLFPILRWTHNKKYIPFTASEIDNYKGIGDDRHYMYAFRTKKAMPCFQLSEPFIEGNDFFEMVEHYLHLLEFVKKEAYRVLYDNFDGVETFMNSARSVGYRYARQLFECVMFCYYDRFRDFDPLVVKKLFTWAMMIRVDMEVLSFETINKYSLGSSESARYSNNIDMFSVIRNARLHTEIANLNIKVLRRNDDAPSDEKMLCENNEKNKLYNKESEIADLYILLKRINGYSKR